MVQVLSNYINRRACLVTNLTMSILYYKIDKLLIKLLIIEFRYKYTCTYYKLGWWRGYGVWLSTISQVTLWSTIQMVQVLSNYINRRACLVTNLTMSILYYKIDKLLIKLLIIEFRYKYTCTYYKLGWWREYFLTPSNMVQPTIFTLTNNTLEWNMVGIVGWLYV
jgi:hypothetical protein